MSLDDAASGIVNASLSAGISFPFAGSGPSSDAIWQQIVDLLARLGRSRPDLCAYVQIVNGDGQSLIFNGPMDADFAYRIRNPHNAYDEITLYFRKFWYQPNTIVLYNLERAPKDVMSIIERHWNDATAPAPP